MHDFHDFIEQVAPYDKCKIIINLGKIKILGQYKVKLLEPDTIGGCLTHTLCRPCQRDS